MGVIRTIVAIMCSAAIVGCTATVVAQFVGLGVLWSRGMLDHDRMVRLAGVVYGMDPVVLQPSQAPAAEETSPADSPEQAIAERVRQTPRIASRQSAIQKRAADIRSVVLRLRINRERQDLARKSFEADLQQLQEANRAAALRELQITLESLPPGQAKDIIFSMLSTASSDPDDPVMDHVVTIIKAMPTEKIRKILGEFKTNNEREMLHRILVEIGKLDEPTQLSGTQP